MFKDSITAILAGLLIAAAAGLAPADGTKRPTPIPDGFSLMGVDGKLTSESATADKEESDKWFFEFEADVSNQLGRISAGTRLEVLPSSALEKMIVNLQQHPDVSYRLWGKVTRYGWTNYIFADYFLPVSEISKQKPATTQESQQETTTADKVEIKINEPNDELTMPEEIIARLQSRKIIRVEQLGKGLKLKQDSILADRTGFIQGSRRKFVFVFDALGRNVETIQLKLLPCKVLEWAHGRWVEEAEPVRFKVAGIVTTYKGEPYLLLQRATRVYNYGNF